MFNCNLYCAKVTFLLAFSLFQINDIVRILNMIFKKIKIVVNVLDVFRILATRVQFFDVFVRTLTKKDDQEIK